MLPIGTPPDGPRPHSSCLRLSSRLSLACGSVARQVRNFPRLAILESRNRLG
jgi:hypothetical protein